VPRVDRGVSEWYETKNVQRLVALGAISAANQAKTAAVFDKLGPLVIAIDQIAVDASGSDAATVRFRRIDTIDGKTQAPQTVTKSLRRVNGRWVAE